MTTTYTIEGTVTGELWWPTGVPAGKQVSRTFERSHATLRDMVGEAATLRDMVDAITLAEGGDFSTAPRLTSDTRLIVTRERRSGTTVRTVERTFDLARFPSIADYIAPDLYGSDFDGSADDSADESEPAE